MEPIHSTATRIALNDRRNPLPKRTKKRMNIRKALRNSDNLRFKKLYRPVEWQVPYPLIIGVPQNRIGLRACPTSPNQVLTIAIIMFSTIYSILHVVKAGEAADEYDLR